jgi:hypothetical protein
MISAFPGRELQGLARSGGGEAVQRKGRVARPPLDNSDEQARKLSQSTSYSLARAYDVPMTAWLLVVACICLLTYLFLDRARVEDDSAKRLAVFAGTQRVWGETDASLRKRSLALTRWPFTKEAPQFRWWARLWHRARPRGK